MSQNESILWLKDENKHKNGKTEFLLESLRKEMIKVGMNKGLTHPETVRISRKIDRILDTYL